MNRRQIFTAIILFFSFECGHSNTITIDPGKGLGRTFDGIGGLSGGGATSKLLINYPEPYRGQILDYLFKPNFGAALHILKVEIGGDSQSTEGTEASHMHSPWDENYNRGYEWWLMKEAKMRNPDILLYGLPWAFPGWIGNGTKNPYDNPILPATYITKWVVAAKQIYGLDIDYIGIWNEKPYSVQYVKVLRATLDLNGMSKVKIVAADNDWSVSNDIQKDAQFAAAVSIIGTHYPGTYSSSEAQQTNKPLWASEDYSTWNDFVGAGCWARILNQNYVNGLMTSTIAWNLIAAYYDDLPYPRCSLMTANEPWSGYYEMSSPLWITAHTTQFTQPGWSYLQHGAGVGFLPLGGSYVSLVSPDKQHVTVVLETMTHDHSICIRPSLPPYTVQPQTVVIQFANYLHSLESVNVWLSDLKGGTSKQFYFKDLGIVKLINGSITLSLDIDQVVTLTTVVGTHGGYGSPPDSRPFPLPYTDNFESYQQGAEPFHLTPQIGSFEVVSLPSSAPATEPAVTARQATLQTVLERPIDWCSQDNKIPVAILGDSTWRNVKVQLDVMLPSVNSSTGIFAAARVEGAGCDAVTAQGIFLRLNADTRTVAVTSDLAGMQVLFNSPFPVPPDTWFHLTIALKESTGLFYVNNYLLANLTKLPDKPANGFVAMGTANFGLGYFDNLDISAN